MNSLVYVMYNKELKDESSRLQKLKEDKDPSTMSDLSLDDEWIVDQSAEHQSNTSIVKVLRLRKANLKGDNET